MSTQRSCLNTWVVVDVRGQEFAVLATHVREILVMPETAAVPNRAPQDRGVINIRGHIIPVIDLRKHFGWPSVPEEMEKFQNLLDRREEDHRKWLEELEKSVVEGTEFRLATDPRQCAFGQWYYSYRSDSPWITALLRKLEPPHDQIHALASSVNDLVKSRQSERARRLIEDARSGVLRKMVSLFQQLKELMRETARELAMVITVAQGTFAVSIDRAVAVEDIAPGLIKDLRIDMVSPGYALLRKTAERSATHSLALVLEPDLLFSASGRLARA